MSADLTPEDIAALALQSLARADAATHASPSANTRAQPLPPATTARSAGMPAENDSDGEDAAGAFEIWRVGQRARERASHGGHADGRPRYSEATGRFTDPAEWERALAAAAAADEDEEERYEDTESETDFVDQAPWVVGRPQRQPLAYPIPTANGGTERRQIAFTVDFADRDSVDKANKARRLAVWRAKKALNMAVLRPSTQDRKYTEESHDMIACLHEDYAMQNGGYQTPYWLLTESYNALFPNENRTESSISSHIAHVPELKAMRGLYRSR